MSDKPKQPEFDYLVTKSFQQCVQTSQQQRLYVSVHVLLSIWIAMVRYVQTTECVTYDVTWANEPWRHECLRIKDIWLCSK